MNKIKKYVILGITALILVAVIYFLSVMYLVTGGFKDYKEYCSHYIPMIEEYRSTYHRYPDSLSEFSPPPYRSGYEPQQCRYSTSNGKYAITVPAGMAGLLVYSSTKQQWAIK